MGTFSAGPLPGEPEPRQGYRTVPSLVQWMISGRCSGQCPHCMTAPGLRMQQLDNQQCLALLDEIANMGIDELLLTGGEPMEYESFPWLLEEVRKRRIRWSLNTAKLPDSDGLRAMQQWPPCFAAVSLDGPQPVHDSIRGWQGAFHESLRAIQVFAELTNGNVAAGTTVSQLNFESLNETFSIVLGSGASTWGLHLVVPEGRARTNARMTLTPRQVRGLLTFAAEKRKYFPVLLADEIGYCGTLEPLLRDAPFFCGAGRTQCVILPNGDVVPCTTFDHREREGNVCERSLSEIWTSGFERFRNHNLLAECASCPHAEACDGGCWLQRRHGIHCHRQVWDHSSSLATAAGMAVCFGLAGCSHQPEAKPPQAPVQVATELILHQDAASEMEQPDDISPTATLPELGHLPAGMSLMDALILSWYREQARAHLDTDRLRALASHLGNDPARPFVQAVFSREHRPPSRERTAQLSAALRSSHPSLHLISLLWRDLAIWCFEGPSPERRSEQETKMLADIMLALGATTKVWRQTIFENKLHPFLHRDDPENRRSFLSKAGPPFMLTHSIHSATKHWGNEGTEQITREYLQAHPFAHAMHLNLQLPPGKSLTLLPIGKSKTGSLSLGLFDLIKVPEGQPIVVQIPHRNSTLIVRLPPATLLTHPDLLRLAYEQNMSELDEAALQQDRHTEPLLLPALRARLARLARPEAPRGSEKEQVASQRYRLIAAWLF